MTTAASISASEPLFGEWTYKSQWDAHLQAQKNEASRRGTTTDTSISIYDLMWWEPPFTSLLLLLLGCTRKGQIFVWDASPLLSSFVTTTATVTAVTTDDNSNVEIHNRPILRVQISDGPLYKFEWCTTSVERPLLLVTGERAVFLVDAKRLLDECLTAITTTTTTSTTKNMTSAGDHVTLDGDTVMIVGKLSTHPHAWSVPTVADCRVHHHHHSLDHNTATSTTTTSVLGAAWHDDFGAYQWDLATEKIVRNFANVRQGTYTTTLDCASTVTSPTSSWESKTVTHTAPSLPTTPSMSQLVTGDTDGQVRLWDIRAQKSHTTLTLSSSFASASSSASLPSRPVLSCRYWSSVQDLTGPLDSSPWLVVGYGSAATSPGNPSLGSRLSSNLSAGDGHLAMFHWPTQSIVASTDTMGSSLQCLHIGCCTSNSVNDGSSNISRENSKMRSSQELYLYTGGNDGRLSVWTPFDLTCNLQVTVPTTPSIHAMASTTDFLAVSGVGSAVDVFCHAHYLPLHRFTL